MGKIRVNSGSGKAVTVNAPGRPSTALVNRPPGSVIPIKTGLSIGVSGFPLYIRNASNTSEIGIASSYSDVATLLNGDSSWNTYGTWSSDVNGVYCSGAAPAHVIGYNKVGVTYNSTNVTNITTTNPNLTLTNNGSAVDFSTIATVAWYRAKVTGYGKTFLSDLELSFNVNFSACNFSSSSYLQVGIEAARSLTVNEASLADFAGGSTGTVISGSVARTLGITYTYTLKLKEDSIIYTIYDGTSTKTVSFTRNKQYSECNGGYFFIDFINSTGTLSNVKVTCTAYKNVDYLLFGDSVGWGRGADSNAQSYYRQVVGSKPNTIFAHGDNGFDMWSDCMPEVLAVAPAKVFIMGSYVDTPSGLPTFQTKYAAIVTSVKTIPVLQKIYHLTSFPNNFSTDIRPFNSWKSSTYNSGIDKFIDAYYGSLEEAGGTGYDLIDAYDWGGSHLTQAAQDIVAAAITANL